MRYDPDTDKVQILFNGVWTDWQNGNMVKTYLYQSGNEYVNLTGGYVVGYFSTHCTAKKPSNSEFLQLNISSTKEYYTYAWLITKNKISTIGHSKLKAKFYTSKDTLVAGIGLTSSYLAGSQTNSASAYPSLAITRKYVGSTTQIEIEIDLSAYQGTYYVVFGVNGSLGSCKENGSVYCSEIYLV